MVAKEVSVLPVEASISSVDRQPMYASDWKW